MKSPMLWLYLLTVTGSQALYAETTAVAPEEGIMDYRQGEYFRSANHLMKANATNNAVVNFYLGRMRLYGYGLLKNNDLALQYLTRAGEQGLLAAQQWLAQYYLHENKPDLALNWFKKAASQADMDAQMYCAGAYLFGFGTSKNSDQARRYYIDAARAGNGLAQYELAEEFLTGRDTRNRNMGVIWLNKAAEKNFDKALGRLGELYATGTAVKKDLNTAMGYLEKAAKLGDVPAQALLGQLYSDKKNTVYDVKKALEWTEKAAKNGSVSAQLALAASYKDGTLTPVNEKLAAEWQDNAKASTALNDANVKDPRRQLALWLSHGKSQSLMERPYHLGGIDTAWNNLEALQENNYNSYPRMHQISRKALYKPQFVYVSPNEIPINDYFDFLAPRLSSSASNNSYLPTYPIDHQIQALQDSQSAVLARDTWISVMDEGRRYPLITEEPANYFDELTQGWQIQANFQQVLTYLYYRAILGDSDAQFKLGQLYQYGMVVAKNIDQSIIYYELAALQQDVRAEYNLGVLYLQGKTDPVNYQKGVDWMMDAAFKGNAYAQYALANIYENGLTDPAGMTIVAANHQQALAMYYLASSNRYALAEFRLAEYLTKENNEVLSVAARLNRTKLVKRLYLAAADAGVVEAILPAAFYEAMDKDAITQKRAFSVADEQAQAGNSLASLLLGIMYERGIGVPANQDEALSWYKKASLNPVSEFILGTYYLQGTGVSQDVTEGKSLLQRAAKAGFSYAHYNLAIVQQQQGESFLAELDTARQAGNSKAGLLLADYYLLQANDPAKMQQAREIYQHFAEKGDRNAQLKLGFLYDRGLGGQVNYELAASWYELSAKQHQPVAQYLLATMYQLGKIGKAPDYDQAKKWLSRAKSYYVPAAVALGYLEDTVDDNYASAWEDYSLAANKGDAIGQYNLALIYDEGKGQPVDKVKATHLYQLSAEQGFSPAMTQLANLHFNGVNGQRDEAKAYEWYEKAAKLGNRDANYQLGLMSEAGVGAELNVANAVKYYQQAADLGDEKALLALARMYQYGLGVTKDVGHAAELYQRLAANNNAFAQYQLAVFNYDGSLGQQRIDEAKRLLNAASQHGSVQATNMLQWMSAQQEQRLSYVLPVIVNKSKSMAQTMEKPADLMYLDAMSEWNRGDELSSRTILNRIVKQFPNYVPAKRIYEQLS